MLGMPFDPAAEYEIRDRCKPHWSQTGTVVFITMRLADSVPRDLIRQWDRERIDWLRRAGVLPRDDENWRPAVELLEDSERERFTKHFHRLRETTLDESLGDCVLQHPAASQQVATSLMKFDGDRYHMGDFVIMPNHVHLMAVFTDKASMLKQCTGWMHYTARQINQSLGRRGALWQTDPFDHLVRSGDQYDYLRGYIRDNPRKAGLEPRKILYRHHPDTLEQAMRRWRP